MNENERLIRITREDIAQANQLSLHCPICAGAVERNTSATQAAPIFCTSCQTLYHLACWEQNGGKCAVLGCQGEAYQRVGSEDLGPVLVIERTDIPREARRPVVMPNGRTKRLKESERRMQRESSRRPLWRDLWQGLLRAIKLWPSDPS